MGGDGAEVSLLEEGAAAVMQREAASSLTVSDDEDRGEWNMDGELLVVDETLSNALLAESFARFGFGVLNVAAAALVDEERLIGGATMIGPNTRSSAEARGFMSSIDTRGGTAKAARSAVSSGSGVQSPNGS